MALRAVWWWVMIAEELDAQRLVFVDKVDTNTSLSLQCTPGSQRRGGTSVCTSQPGTEYHAAFEHEP